MNFFIVNAYGRSNRGDSVLLDECISEIKFAHQDSHISGALFEGISGAKNVHPDVNWSERIGNVEGKGVISRLLTLFYMFISLISLVKLFSFLRLFLPRQQRATLEGIIKSDALVSAPGGYIHDTNFAYIVAIFHIYLGCILKKKVFLAPQSIGPLESRFSKLITSFVLSRVDIICARESYTYDFLLNKLKLNSDIIVKCGDSAFWNFNERAFDDEVETIFTDLDVPEGKKILGLTFVGWTFPHAESPDELYNLYVSKMAQVIDYLVQKYDVAPVVFNQVDGDIPTAEACRKLCNSEIYIDKVSREPDILRAAIRKSDVFIGTRFHSCIFSMMAGRPTFAISYLPKTEFIMNDLGLNDRYTKIEDFNVEYVIKKISSDIENLKAAENKIEESVQGYREKYPRLSDVMVEAVNDEN